MDRLANSSSGSPCAACKFLRRKCTSECVFSPYFPPDQPLKFANVHKIFGASNISKLLNDLPPHQREDAVNSLAYEADARVKDPVYGCVGSISVLQRQVAQLTQELGIAQTDLVRAAQLNQHHHHHSLAQSQQLDLNANLQGHFLGIHHQQQQQQQQQQQHHPWIEVSGSVGSSYNPAVASANYEMLVIQRDYTSSPTQSTIINDSNCAGGDSNPAAGHDIA